MSTSLTEQLKSAINAADSIIIGAGAGLSTSAGFTYSGERFKEHFADFEEKFDAVLCDAPCSGFGTVSENADIKLFRKEEDFAALKSAQTAILSNVSRYVKKGGALYYSTCSLFECENDYIVETFLKTHPDYEVENIESPLVNEKKRYGLQFLPDTAYGAGFYVCKMRRV